MKFTFIDLFAGIGGIRKALVDNGGECLFFSEIDNDAINTYCKNSNESITKNLGDITKIKYLPSHNILTAGVPCQSWSIAGKNLGFDDDRGQLWNDTLFLLNQSKPDVFIFENVKGLADPRNKKALAYIMKRIEQAGYFASYYVLNSFDYGVPQNRIRIYIIGFKNQKFASSFTLPAHNQNKLKLVDILSDFSKKIEAEQFSSAKNHFFMFNDLRNGDSTIHSWDIKDTTERQKDICYLLLKNRRKRIYGNLDGNPLSLNHFQSLDNSITVDEIEELIKLDILKKVDYSFKINTDKQVIFDSDELVFLSQCAENVFIYDDIKTNRKLKKMPLKKIIESLLNKKVLELNEIRYDFKNTKISTGIYGVNRIFLPSSNIFPTLVASDANDFITTHVIEGRTNVEYKKHFINEVFNKQNYRKINKEESCLIQGFPKDYILPNNRTRWMKLIGNSVTIPVIDMLIKAIIATGVFTENNQQT